MISTYEVKIRLDVIKNFDMFIAIASGVVFSFYADGARERTEVVWLNEAAARQPEQLSMEAM